MNLRKWLLGVLLIGALFFGGNLSTQPAHFHYHSIAGSKTGGSNNHNIAGSKTAGSDNHNIAGSKVGGSNNMN
jgi:hypothetical protein